jgi:putative tryptophan/tyrosine transport system substrate-binding protein
VRRREFITLLGCSATAWPLAARAQQGERVRRIGVLMGGFVANDPEGQARVTAFQGSLQGLGWVGGRSAEIEYRWAPTTDLMQTYAKEIVEWQPDVILGQTTPAVGALMRATPTIPIVFVQVNDPVGQGMVQSLSNPGGHVTGFSAFEFSLGSKWLEILKEIAPHVARVAVIFNPKTAPYFGSFLRPLEAAALSVAVESIATSVHDAAEIERGIALFANVPNGGLIVLPDTFTLVNRAQIIALANEHRLPAIYPFRYHAVDGGLVSYGIDTIDLYRRAASYVDRILRGAKPADLPVQQPTKFELAINLKTAKILGLTFPPGLLATADEVIE